MIDAGLAKPGLHVFYQQRHMRSPEYGTIQSVSGPDDRGRTVVRVLFLSGTTAKACRPEDLFWPPDFCARDGVNPPGQIFDHNYG